MAEEVFRLAERLPPPDIIESQEYNGLPYYLIQRRLTERTRLNDVPIVTHLHSPTFELARINQAPRYRFPEYWIGQMEKFCIASADALLSPSRFLAREIQQALPQKLDITTIPLPFIIQEDYAPEIAQPNQFMYVGRLEVRKGVLPLLVSCSRLWEAGVDFQLTLIGGDTPFVARDTTVETFIRKRYERWIERGKLTLVGPMSHSEVLQRMRQAWAVIVPSLWENFPNTCIEAMAVGQVVLASRSGGQAEMIEHDGINGFLFDWEMPGDFEQKLQMVLGLSSQERQNVAKQAYSRIRAFGGPDVIIPKRIAHYEQVIAQYQPRTMFPTVYKHADTVQTTGSGYRTSIANQPRLLSVVIPFYNLGAYVEEALNSVIESTYQPTEIIIVNDGSTDPSSLAVLGQIEARRIPNLRVVHTENQGLAATRNTGAHEAHGEFVCFLDADDLIEPDFYARAIDVLDRYDNVDFVSSWDRYFEADNGIWPTWNAEFPYLLGHNMLSAFAVVRRASFIGAARNSASIEYSLEDFDGWIGLLASGGVGVSLPAPLVRYRARRESMYHSSNENQKLYLYDLITHRHAEAYRQWGVELFNLQNANGPAYLWPRPDVPQPTIPQLQRQINEILAERDALRNRLAQLESTGESRLIHGVRRLQQSRHYHQIQPVAQRSYTLARNAYRFGRRLKSRVQFKLSRQMMQLPEVHIQATGKANLASEGVEVWLLDVQVPTGDEVVESQIWNTHTPWTLRASEMSRHGQAVVTERPARLNLRVPTGTLLMLLKHPWSGIVEIVTDQGMQTIDLYSPQAEVAIYRVGDYPKHTTALNKGASPDVAQILVQSPEWNTQEAQWLKQIQQANPRAIAVLHPDWRGIRSSTTNLFSNVLYRDDTFTATTAARTARLIAASGAKKIVFSGFPSSYEHVIRALRQQAPETEMFVLWHANFLQLNEPYNWQVFQQVERLYHEGFISKCGFVKRGMAEVMTRRGIRSAFVMNYVRDIPQGPSQPTAEQIGLGIWALESIWRKSPYASLAATLLVPDINLFCSGHDTHVQEFIHAFGVKAKIRTTPIPQKEMRTALAQMHLNLYITLSECAPMLPLESLAAGAPCLIGPTSHYFDDDPYLHERLVVSHPDDTLIIAGAIERAIAERTQIIAAYQNYAPSYNARAIQSLRNFLEIDVDASS
jgi:glycosyltransferase involved in cell wall biosynthesis